MAVNLAEAFIQITPTTKGMQNTIANEFKGLGKIGDAAGKDISDGMGKSLGRGVKGKGKAAGDEVGKEFTGSVEKSFSSLKVGAVAGIFSGLAQSAVGSFGEIISGAAQASDATDKFKQTMSFAGFDTKAIEQVTASVQTYADKTVYELGDIQNMTAQLASNGVQDYAKLAEAAGNLNAVSGGNAETFKSVGMVMSQTAGAGKLTTENWNQLADAIPGASGQIQKALLDAGAYTGNFRDAMANGEITAEEFNAAVMKLGSEPVAQEAAQSTQTFEGMLGNLKATVEGGLANAFNQLKPIIGNVINSISNVASTAIPLFVSAVQGVAGALQSVGSWVQNNSTWLGPLVAAIAGAATAYKVWTGAITAWQTITKMGTAIQTAFNAVMAANPIMLVTMAVAGLVAGLVWFFTQTEVGKAAWQSFTDFLGSAWETIKDAFSAGWEWIKGVFSGFGETIESVKGFFSGLGDSISSAWDTATGALSAGWELVKSAVFDAWNSHIQIVQASWDAFTGAISAAWELVKNAFSAGWQWIQSIFFSVFDAAVGQLKSSWEGWSNLASSVWERVKQAFSNAWQFIQSVVFEPFKAAISVVKAVFSGNTDAMKSAFEGFKSAIHGAIETIKGRLTSLVEAFKQIPGKIKSAFSNAGSWLLDAGRSIISGLANGIRNAGSAIMDAIRAVVPDSVERFVPGLHFGGLLPGFARGGVLPSIPGISNSQRDPILGWSVEKKQPIARIEPGEFVVNRKATKKFLPLLAAINGGKLNSKKGDWGLHGYADGGVVGYSDVIRWLKGETVAGNPAPRPLDGTPYVWGGGLDSNWGDCSGLQSAIASIVAGVDATGRKFATMSQGSWLGAHGFKRGRSSGKNAFETAYFNGGPYGGHTAGTLYGPNGEATNVEMGGGRGDGQLGGPAAGSRHSQFTDIWWHPLKGTSGTAEKILNTSVDGATVQTTGGEKKEVSWGSAQGLFELAKRGVRLFDTGGLWRTGQLGFNAGPNEHVMSPFQWDRLVQGLTDVATAVKQGNLGYELIYSKFGSRAEDMAFEATGGVLGGWESETKLLTDAEKALAEMRADSSAKAEDIAAAEKAVAVARKASISKGFNNGSNLQAFFANGKLADFAATGSEVGGLMKNLGMSGLGGVVSGLSGSVSDALGATSKLKKAYDEQAEAESALVGAEASLKAARLEGDQAKIADAEEKLATARETVATVAAATGNIEIATAIKVAESAIAAVKLVIDFIDGKVQAVFAGIATAWSAISNAFKSMGELSAAVAKLREQVAGLVLDQAMAQIELAAAVRNTRMVQMDSMVAQLQGVKNVAEAQAAFDAQRRADAKLAALSYDDLSLAFDRFRWNTVGATDEFMAQTAAWSDESHALYAELLAAQVQQQILDKKARLDGLEATYKQTLASMNLADVTANLNTAAQKLAVAAGKAFGMDQVEATVGQRYADLVAERTKLQADQASIGTWINPVNWFTAMPSNQRRIDQINSQLAQLEAMEEFKSIDPAVKSEADRLAMSAGFMGFFGAGDQVETMVKNSALGDAARALDEVNFQNSLIDIRADQEELRRKVEKQLAEVNYRSEADPLQNEIDALGFEKAAQETWAEYWRTNNDAVRAALADIGKAQADAATQVREVKTVQLVGNQFDADGVANMLDSLGVRVERLEQPPVNAATVALGRR